MGPSALVIRSLWVIAGQGKTASVRLGVKGSQVRILSARRRSKVVSGDSGAAFFRLYAHFYAHCRFARTKPQVRIPTSQRPRRAPSVSIADRAESSLVCM
jgi:hypothetical protein